MTEEYLRQTKPVCNASIQALERSGYKVVDDCPGCKDHRILCRIAHHPSEVNVSFQDPRTGRDFTQKVKSRSAFLDDIDISASKIANQSPEAYDLFAQICGPHTYVPNIGIQNLIDLQLSSDQKEKAARCQSRLEQNLLYVDTFRPLPRGSESTLVDVNLQAVLRAMAEVSDDKLVFAKKNDIPYTVGLARSIKPEHCLHINHPYQTLIFGAEAKGIEDSIRSCYPQLFAVCGSCCMELKRLGLHNEDCVLLGIAIAGSSCQFCAVYLLNDSFPVMTALSPELSLIGTFEDLRKISEWCLKCVVFSSLTWDKLHFHSSQSVPAPQVCLNLDEYFVKPVRDHLKSAGSKSRRIEVYSRKHVLLNRIMQIYEVLRIQGNMKEMDIKSVVLFPEGVVSVPSHLVTFTLNLRNLLVEECIENGFGGIEYNYRPIILFPRLSSQDGWDNSRPEENIKHQYIKLLQNAIDALNQAGVAHLDLRPSNIMWRQINKTSTSSSSSSSSSSSFSTSQEIEMRIIDFEDAVLFNHVIPSLYIACTIKDPRYPFLDVEDEQSIQYANASHNQFFVNAIILWLDSNEKSFDTFMRSKRTRNI